MVLSVLGPQRYGVHVLLPWPPPRATKRAPCSTVAQKERQRLQARLGGSEPWHTRQGAGGAPGQPLGRERGALRACPGGTPARQPTCPTQIPLPPGSPPRTHRAKGCPDASCLGAKAEWMGRPPWLGSCTLGTLRLPEVGGGPRQVDRGSPPHPGCPSAPAPEPPGRGGDCRIPRPLAPSCLLPLVPPALLNPPGLLRTGCAQRT